MIKVTIYDDELQRERTFQGEGAVIAVRAEDATEVFVGGDMTYEELAMLACRASAGAVQAIQSMKEAGE